MQVTACYNVTVINQCRKLIFITYSNNGDEMCTKFNKFPCDPAAREDVYGVCVGGVLGHALCTGLAVLGGRMIATRISVRTVTLVSTTVQQFSIFGLTLCSRLVVSSSFCLH